MRQQAVFRIGDGFRLHGAVLSSRHDIAVCATKNEDVSGDMKVGHAEIPKAQAVGGIQKIIVVGKT